MEMHNAASAKVTKVGLRKDTIFLPPRRFFAPLGANASYINLRIISLHDGYLLI